MEHDNDTLSPFRIDLILKEVLSNLTVSSLLTCRLVARSWNTEAVYWIRRKQTQRTVVQQKDWPRFCNDFENCELYPFGKLGLWPGGCTADLLTTFFTQHGHFIKDMCFWGSNLVEEGTENISHILRILGHVLNLKKLAIIFNFTPQFTGEIRDDPRLTQVEHVKIGTSKFLSQEFLDRFFALVPNVKSLKFGEGFPDDVQCDALLGALRKVDLRKVVIPRKASVRVDMGMGIFRAISRTQKLTDLEISLYSDLWRTRETTDLVEAQDNLFKSQASSLKELCIRNGIYDPDRTNHGAARLQLPFMKNLRRAFLSFHQYFGEDVSSPVPFNIVPIRPEQVPSLHALTVNTMFLNSGALDSSPFQSVQELVLENVGQIFDVLPVIAPNFPNLKKLRNLDTKLGVNEMGIIVTSWPQIEELEIDIRCETGTDDDFNLVVSGVSSETSCWLEEAVGKLARNRGLPFCRPILNPSGPSLRHLTSLKKLRLYFYKHEDPLHIHDPIHIDEIGVYLTCLQLSSQVCLSLEGHYSISNDLAAMMTEHYQTLYFKPLSSYIQD